MTIDLRRQAALEALHNQLANLEEVTGDLRILCAGFPDHQQVLLMKISSLAAIAAILKQIEEELAGVQDHKN